MRGFGGAASVSVALAAFLTGAFAPVAGAAFPGQNGKIAFTTFYLDGNENIYSVAPDGTALQRLTNDPGFDDDAAWSPNGRRIAFASNRAHPEQACEGLNPRCDYDIYVMSYDGSNVRRLTDSQASDRDPAWSPDGRRIVFSSTRDNADPSSGEFANSELYVMNADGTAQTRITDYPGTDHQAAWSPDGASIAFRRAACEFNCSPAIFKVAPNGSGLTQLTSDVNGRDRMPNWAPDGSKIVFAREVGSQHFFTMNPDGGSQTIIFGEHGDPAWSPDGARIAYGFPGIGHIKVDGSDARTVNTSGGEKPDWQPVIGPQRASFKSARDFCRAELAFLGPQEFEAVYRTFGGCVSAKS
jgi:Tol biopolymer transport system component